MTILHTIRTAKNFIFILFKEKNISKTEFLTRIYNLLQEYDYFNYSSNELEFEVQVINKYSNNDPKNKLIIHDFLDFLPPSFEYLELKDYIKHVNDNNKTDWFKDLNKSRVDCFLHLDTDPFHVMSTYDTDLYDFNDSFLDIILYYVNDNVEILFEALNLEIKESNLKRAYFRIEWNDLKGKQGIVNDWISYTQNEELYQSFLDRNYPNWFNTLLKYNNKPIKLTIS